LALKFEQCYITRRVRGVDNPYRRNMTRNTPENRFYQDEFAGYYPNRQVFIDLENENAARRERLGFQRETNGQGASWRGRTGFGPNVERLRNSFNTRLVGSNMEEHQHLTNTGRYTRQVPAPRTPRGRGAKGMAPRPPSANGSMRNAAMTGAFVLSDVATAAVETANIGKNVKTKFDEGATHHAEGLIGGLSQDDGYDTAAQSKADLDNRCMERHKDWEQAGISAVTAVLSGATMLSGQDAVETTDIVHEEIPEGTTTMENLQGFTFKNMFSRQIAVGSFTWDGTQAQNTVLYFKLIIDLFLLHPYIEILKKFTYVRWESMTIQFQYEANPFYAGVARGFFVPGRNGIRNAAGTQQRFTMNDLLSTGRGEWMYACMNEEIEITANWIYPKEWLCINSALEEDKGFNLNTDLSKMLGAIYMLVMHPLVIPDGSATSLTFNVLLSFNGLEVSVPTSDYGILPTVTASTSGAKMQCGFTETEDDIPGATIRSVMEMEDMFEESIIAMIIGNRVVTMQAGHINTDDEEDSSESESDLDSEDMEIMMWRDAEERHDREHSNPRDLEPIITAFRNRGPEQAHMNIVQHQEFVRRNEEQATTSTQTGEQEQVNQSENPIYKPIKDGLERCINESMALYNGIDDIFEREAWFVNSKASAKAHMDTTIELLKEGMALIPIPDSLSSIVDRDDEDPYTYLLKLYEYTVTISLIIAEIQRKCNSAPQPEYFICFRISGFVGDAKKALLQCRVKLNDMLMAYRGIPRMQMGSEQEMFYYPTTNRYNTHDHSATFSPDMDIARTTGYRGLLDETESHFLFNIFNLSANFSMDSTSTPGTFLYTAPIGLSKYRINVPTVPRRSWSLISNYSAYWAGSMVFKIVISKNIFHKGKMIVWRTSQKYNQTSESLDKITQNPYIIFDLSQKNSFTFRVAEMTSLAVRRMRVLSLDGLKEDQAGDTMNGYLNIAVYVPLATTTGQSTTIQMSLWEAGYPGDEDGSHRMRCFTPTYARPWDRRRNHLQGGWQANTVDMILGTDIVNSKFVGTELEELTGGQMLFKKKQMMEIAKRTDVTPQWHPLMPVNIEVTADLFTSDNDETTYTYFPDQFIKMFANNYAFWSGDLNFMIETNVDINIIRQMPNTVGDKELVGASDETNWNPTCNWKFGSGPGMMLIKNGSQMMTVNVQNYNKFKMFVTNRQQLTLPANISEQSQLFYGSQLIIDSYDSETLNPASKAIIFYSAMPNFWLGGYQCAPQYTDLEQHSYNSAVLQEPTVEDSETITDLPPPLPPRNYNSITALMNQARMQVGREGIGRGRGRRNTGYDRNKCSKYTWVKDINQAKKEVIQSKVTTSGSSSLFTSDEEDDEPPLVDSESTTENITNAFVSAVIDDKADIRASEYEACFPGFSKNVEDAQDKTYTDTTRLRKPAEYGFTSIPQVFCDTMNHSAESLESMAKTGQSLTEEARKMRRDGKRAAIKIEREISNASNSLCRTASKAEGAFSKIESFMDEVTEKGLLRAIGLESSDAALIAVLGLDIGYAIIKNKRKRWVEFGIKLAASIGLKFFDIAGILKVCLGFDRNEVPNGPTMQAGIEPSQLATALTIAVLAISFKATGGDQVDEKKCKTTWDFLSQKSRDMANMKLGIGAFMAGFGEIKIIILEALKEYVFEGDEEVEKVLSESVILTKMSSLSRTAKELMHPKKRYELAYWNETKQEFITAYEEMNQLRSEMTLATVSPLTWQKFVALERTYSTLSDAGLDNVYAPTIRHDMFHVSIHGDTKIGKSTVATSVGKLLARSQHADGNGKIPLIYPRAVGSEFNDNYCGQPVFFIDDIDAIDDPEAVMAHMERKSNIPVVLPMARIEKKGIHLLSKIMISTTNVLYPAPKSSQKPKAYQRRRDILVDCKKIQEGIQLDHSHLRFDIVPAVEGERDRGLPKDLTFEQLGWYCMYEYGEFCLNQRRVLKKSDKNMKIDDVYRYPAFMIGSKTIPEQIEVLLKTELSDEDPENEEEEEGVHYMGNLGRKMQAGMNKNGPYNTTQKISKEELEMKEFDIEMRRISNLVVQLMDDCCYADTTETNFEMFTTSLAKRLPGFVNSEKILDYNKVYFHTKKYMTEVSQARFESLLIDNGEVLYADEECWEMFGTTHEVMIEEDEKVSGMTGVLDPESIDRVGITAYDGKPYVFYDSEGFRFFINYDQEIAGAILKAYERVASQAVHKNKDSLMAKIKKMYQITGEYLNPDDDGILTLLTSGLISIVSWKDIDGLFEVAGILTEWDFLIKASRKAQTVREGVIMKMKIPRNMYEEAEEHLYEGSSGLTIIIRGILKNLVLLFEIIVFTPFNLINYIKNAIYKLKMWLNQKLAKYIGTYYSSIVILLGASLFLGYMYSKNVDEARTSIKSRKPGQKMESGDSLKIQGHDHMDVPDDNEIHNHIHLCEKCGEVFSHSHKKHSLEFSEKFVHWCKKCMRKKLNEAINAAHSTTQSVDMPMGEESTVPAEKPSEFKTMESKGYMDERSKKKPRRVIRLEGALLDSIKKKTVDFVDEYEKIHVKCVEAVTDATKVKIFDKIMTSYADQLFVILGNKRKIDKVAAKLKIVDILNEYYNFEIESPEDVSDAKKLLYKNTVVKVVMEGMLEVNKSGELNIKDPIRLSKLLEEVEVPEKKMEAAMKRPAIKTVKAEITMEASPDSQTAQIMPNVALNMGTIHYGNLWMGYVGLQERKILVNGHLFGDLSLRLSSYTIRIMRLGKEFSVTVKGDNIKRPDKVWDNTTNGWAYPDYLILDLHESPQVPQFTNITSYFCFERDLDTLDCSSGRMIAKEKNSQSNMSYELNKLELLTNQVMFGPVGGTFYSAKQWHYKASTTAGTCGSPIFVYNSRIPRKIVGIHQAAYDNTNDAYGIIITQEMINRLLGPRTSVDAMSFDDMIGDKQMQVGIHREPRILPPGNHLILGTLNKAGTVPRRTDIRATPIFNEVSVHKTEPAILTKRDPRNLTGKHPIEVGITKFNQEAGQWNPTYLKMAVDHYVDESIKYTEESYGGPKRILTLHEAINGIPGWITPIDMYTSAGYPYSTKRPSNSVGKLFLFDKIGEREDGSPLYEAKAELVEDINYLLENVKKYKVVRNYFTDEMKDERRPLEKIKSCKTRIFNTHNVAWQLVTKMYYGAYMAMYMKARTRLSSTLGLNMHGPEVTQLVNHLTEVGNNMFPGDVSRWDGTFDFETSQGCVEVVSRWLTHFHPEYDIWEIKTVGSTFHFRIHIIGDTVYITFIGMPSGKFLTALFNTLGHNIRKVVIIFEVATKKQRFEVINFKYVRENFRDVRNGDDMLESVSDSMKEWYTVKDIIETWAEHGIEVTAPTKAEGDFVEDFEPITNVQYLKSTFVPDGRYTHPALWKMAMSKVTIEELFNWIRDGSTVEERLEANAHDAMQFAYAHGPKYYNDLRQRALKVLRNKKINIRVPNFEEFDISWLGAHELAGVLMI